MEKGYFIALVLILSFLSFTHSDGKSDYSFSSKGDYEKLIKLQQKTEQTLLQTYDFDIKISNCDNVINSLDKFIKKYSSSEWSDTAIAALESWKSRKIKLTSQYSTLINELSSSLQDNAEKAANHKHKMSTIVRIDLISQSKHTEGSKLSLTNQYTVSMIGKILKKAIYTLKITTSGSISIDDRIIFVNDNPQIEEVK